ncbi:MAG TPA: hypothetical protein DIV86_06175 [Alphaproteobacteria bacterium]|nr:hypothetical protein [Alphaproteobacteria bacterium]
MSKRKIYSCLSIAAIAFATIIMTATESHSISFFDKLLSKENETSEVKKQNVKEEMTKYDNWNLSCLKSVKTGQKQCRIFQQVTSGKNKNTVLGVSFIAARGKTVSAMRVIAPLGVNLISRLGMNIDNSKAVKIPFQLCRPVGCIVLVNIQDVFIKKLKSGNIMHITYQGMGAKNVQKIDVPLKGFSKALEALEKEHGIKNPS